MYEYNYEENKSMKKIYFSEEIANYLGKLDEAVFFNNICYWVETNRYNEINKKDGKYWTYNSDTSLKKMFPYFSISAIRRMRRNLLKAGLIEIGNYNKWKQDKTTWYTYTDKAKTIVHEMYFNDLGISRFER